VSHHDYGKGVPLSFRRWNGRFHENYYYRYANGLPIRDEENAPEVGWVELTVTRTDTQEILYRNAIVTDWTLEPENVPLLLRLVELDGRLRMKTTTFSKPKATI
jgi:hypothetical protein